MEDGVGARGEDYCWQHSICFEIPDLVDLVLTWKVRFVSTDIKLIFNDP